MKITPKQYAQALYELVIDKSPKEANLELGKFVSLLAKQGKLSLTNKIIEQFMKIWDKEHSEIEAEIITARKLDKSIAKELIEDLVAKKTKVKNITAKEYVNKDILGGVIIKYEDKVIDASLRSKLQELREAMSN